MTNETIAAPEQTSKPVDGESELNVGLGEIILENSNGVQIREGLKSNGHYLARNAECFCGEHLLVAPMLFHANHKKGDPVMICRDHGVHAFRFLDLTIGRQETPNVKLRGCGNENEK